jgi:hypothetical protein
VTISIDLDNTWTADPALWLQFYESCLVRGHQVVMVTNRQRYSSDMDRFHLPASLLIIYAGGKLKSEAAADLGISVDVWIDDMPGTVSRCMIIGSVPDADL